MNTYEVFLKKAGKEPFSHAGSLDAPDDELAVAYARETYGRRSEGEQMWVVDRSAVLVGDKIDLALADLVAELRRSDRGHARQIK
jgi:phenylacetate-CoA oxygenase PaaH subunit